MKSAEVYLVLFIFSEADEYSNNIYNNKLLNRKKNRVTETPISSSESKKLENSAQHLETLHYLKDEKISTNIMTKRILADKLKRKQDDSNCSVYEGENNKFSQQDIEEKRLFKSETKRKLKRYKKSGNINIKLENTTERNLKVHHKCKNLINY